MLLSNKIRSHAWWFPIIIYIIIIIYKIVESGFSAIYSPLIIGIYIALFQSFYNNVEKFRIPLNYIYYSMFNIQFELELNGLIQGDSESMEKIDEKKIHEIISKIYKDDKLENRIKEFNVNKLKKSGKQYELYLAAYGLNLKLEIDNHSEESVFRVRVESQQKYRKIRKMYEGFLKVFLNEVENVIQSKNEIKYSMKVFPETKEKNFFALQYLKNIGDVKHFSISKKNGSISYEINSSYISINSKYREDVLQDTSKILLRLK